MDYEKKYKNLVAKIKNAYLYAQTDSTKAVLESIFPELAESEDERVNEEIRNFLIDMECKREWIAYLEKQKEQKPAEWSEEDEEKLGDPINYFEGDTLNCSSKDMVAWLKSLRPQSHWKPSAEQMGSLRLAIDSAKKAQMNATANILNEIYEQLKKL